MKRAGLFFCIFFKLCIVPDPILLSKSLNCDEKNQLDQRNKQAQQTFQQLLDGPKLDIPAGNPDFVMRCISEQVPAQTNSQQIFRSTTVYYDEPMVDELANIDVPNYQPTVQKQNNYEQSIVSRLDNNSDDDQLAKYMKVVTACLYYGYQGYKFLKKDKNHVYHLQQDVLDVPYKKMVYVYTKAIHQLIQGAQNQDNIAEQIRSLILLCRIPVPAWYAKSFQKGVDIVLRHCFDEHGNFKQVLEGHDIKNIFKEYLKKAPQSWQDIAKIADWWCKNKNPEPVAAKYNMHTMTEHNQQLLSMIQADQLEDLGYVKKMVHIHGSVAAQKVYDYHRERLLQDNRNEFGVWSRADCDPLWKNLSQQEKQNFASGKDCNELLMMRDLRAQQLSSWLLQKYDKYSLVQDTSKHPVILDAFYHALSQDQGIFEDHTSSDVLRKIVVKCMIYLVEHQDEFDQNLIFTKQGILKKYEYHPLIYKDDVMYDGDLQVCMNCALIFQSDCFDEQTRLLAYHVADHAKIAQSCDDMITKVINRQCALQIFDVINLGEYRSVHKD